MLEWWVAADPLSLQLLSEARRVATTASTVLVRGESGTGKSLLASLLHYLSPASEQPVITLDCATLPTEILECELFGCERNGWAESARAKPGALEFAGNGTLVLREVAALTMPVQAKLLRAIEEQRFERVGGSRTLRVEARILALSSVDLERAAARRTFREDLYYRLSVTSLHVPALRERPGDIVPLAKRFAAQLAELHRKPRRGFGPGVLAALQKYSYAGNVSELRSVVEHAVVHAAAPELMLPDLPPQIRPGASAAPERMLSLDEMERIHIAEVLEFTHGRKSEAAKVLGISRKTLLEKRKKYGFG